MLVRDRAERQRAVHASVLTTSAASASSSRGDGGRDAPTHSVRRGHERERSGSLGGRGGGVTQERRHLEKPASPIRSEPTHHRPHPHGGGDHGREDEGAKGDETHNPWNPRGLPAVLSSSSSVFQISRQEAVAAVRRAETPAECRMTLAGAHSLHVDPLS